MELTPTLKRREKLRLWRARQVARGMCTWCKDKPRFKKLKTCYYHTMIQRKVFGKKFGPGGRILSTEEGLT